MYKENIFCLIVALVLHTVFTCAQDRILRNKINPSLMISVGKSNESLLFRYTLGNEQTAEQPIWQFELHLNPEITILTMSSPVKWDGSYLNEDGDLMIHWATSTDDDIQSGQLLAGYSISAISIPGIVPYYAEGWVPSPDSIAEDYEQDSIYHNLTPYGPGVVGKTIGPAPIPDPFSHTAFLDTLISYTRQSFSLGWITSSAIAGKYTGYFTTARSQVQQRNIPAARSTLQTVLQQADRDSSASLTSEAYALIRYNAEYLLQRLVEEEQVTIDDLIGMKHQAETNGWIGDKNFVNELDNHLENARKHLQKGDSTNAYKEVEQFQQKVNKEYERTVENQKKNKPRDKRFVTVEGWNLLYPNAQKVLDSLTRKKK